MSKSEEYTLKENNEISEKLIAFLKKENKKLSQDIHEVQEIIEASFDGILVTDRDANVIMVNQSYVRHTNISKDELLGHNMGELINPVWMKESVTILVKDTGQPATLHHKTRNNRNIIATGMPIFNPKGEISKIVVNTRDISEIYQLREELLLSRQLERQYYEQAMGNGEAKKSNIVALNPKMMEVFSLAKQVAGFHTSVHITGESGVGKEIIANYIHEQSSHRKDCPFVAVNCGAIAESLLESELFGYEDGAFTGAIKGGKKGLVEAAAGGTLFLDEISEISPNLQVKLLRVLETFKVMRVGSNTEIFVEFRLVTASNKDLSALVEKGAFRDDLYYRLSVVTLNVPPLRARKEEIPVFAMHFLRLYNAQYGIDKKMGYDVLKELESQPWKGNVRQLKNTVEYMVVVSQNEYLQLEDLPWLKQKTALEEESLSANASFNAQVEAFEKKLLMNAKEKYGSSRKIAEALQIDQSTVIRKMQKLKMNL